MASWLDHQDDTTPPIRRPESELLVPAFTLLAHPQTWRIGEQALLLGLRGGALLKVGPRTPQLAPIGGTVYRGLETEGSEDAAADEGPPWFEVHGLTGALSLVASNPDFEIHVDGEPLTEPRRVTADALAEGVVILVQRRFALVMHWQDPSPERPPGYGLLGEGPAMLLVRREIGRLSRLRFNVLLHGELGTGKEQIARSIHDHSMRVDRPFLSVRIKELSCAEVGPTLFGAAADPQGGTGPRRGLFLEAEGGTLFIDQVLDTPGNAQMPLLHTLESREIRPIGGRGSVEVDVRVIATTDTDLLPMTWEARTRSALLHRLGGYDINVPALRQRREDLGPLLLYFLRRHGAAESQPISAPLLYRLALAPWKNNLPQLEKVAQHLLVAARPGEPLSWSDDLEALCNG